MNEDLIYRCPETNQELKSASKQRINAVNKKIDAGTILNGSGKRVMRPIEGGYERKDKKVLYPFRAGVVCFLLTDRIEL